MNNQDKQGAVKTVYIDPDYDVKTPDSAAPILDKGVAQETGNHSQGVSRQKSIQTHIYKRRWIMVFLFVSLSLSNAYQWIHLNIVFNIIHLYYNSSLPGDRLQQEVAIHWLSMVYMLAYIPLIFPATWLLDRWGLRVVGILATLFNALGAWIKCAALDPGRFPVLMLGQTICAVAQVFILGVPARLAAVWFGPDQVSTATAIGVFGNQVGCAVGFFLPPLIILDVTDFDVITFRLSVMLYGTAAVTTVLFVLVLIVYQNKPPLPPSPAQAMILEDAAHENYAMSLRLFVRNRNFLLLVVTYGLNTGSYYAIGTLLNPIVLDYFKFPGATEMAGYIGLTLVLAGVLGSIIAGIWLDKTKLFKMTTLITYLMSLVGMAVFTFTVRLQLPWLTYLCAGALGFFMTGYLPVGFEFAAEMTYPLSEGTSSGLLNASAQAFGITLTLGMGALMNKLGTFAANLAICLALLLGTIGTSVLKEDLRRQRTSEACFEGAEQALTIDVDTDKKEVNESNI